MKCSRKCSGEIWESAPSLTVTPITLLACCSCAMVVILWIRSLIRENSCIYVIYFRIYHIYSRSFTDWVINRLFYFSDIPRISVVNSYGYLVLHVSQLFVPTSQLPKTVRYLLQNIFLLYHKQPD